MILKRKKLFAKSAFHGYEMWKQYAELKNLPFRKDGVIEVALDQQGIKILEKYEKWGKENGLDQKDIELLGKTELKKIEPEIKCEAALHVHRDASTDYSIITKAIMLDSKKNNIKFIFNKKVTEILNKDGIWHITLDDNQKIFAKFLINAAGGESIDIAHRVGIAENFTDVHFRGEYWKAPKEYLNITKTSIYSVPEVPDYPFLDPHWIIRVDGRCEIGPNAVPVF